ncbi:MAG: ParB/RepB/Spo0J family partition protein [Ardenticatenia bacterium]|nr:ParB/RepB/Spo0J family partition protein [Ardenticatenia bacterium]
MARKRQRLGKGLGALIPAEGRSEKGGIREVPIQHILPNPHQPRQRLSEAELEELAASIRTHGLLQPLIVTRMEEGAVGERYQLIAGERRWRAAKRAGLATVPVVIREATEQQMLEWALIENVQRADLNPLEEAWAYRQLAEMFGMSHSQIAKRVGKSRVAVTNMLRLLKLPEAVQRLVLEGELTEGHARALLALEDEEEMVRAAEAIRRRGLNVRQAEAMVRRWKAEEEAGTQPRAQLLRRMWIRMWSFNWKSL